MGTIVTKDGVEIFYKDWGPTDAQPIVFHNGWPLSADDWDAQLLYFLGKGYRVVAHDRRGHGRSSQVSEGPTARPPIRLFHLVFESHPGRAVVPIPKRSTSPRAASTLHWWIV
jgi:pimeloyl-ACP methyl ester carboxylesterase